MLVVDVSAILPLAFSDEDHSYSREVVRAVADEGATVPPLFWFEVWNVLVTNEVRRNRIIREQSARFVELLEQMRIEIAALPQSDALLSVAREHDITAYDAAYLELALRLNAPIATKDEKLSRIASSASLLFAP